MSRKMKTRAGPAAKAYKRGIKRNNKGLKIGKIKQKRSYSQKKRY